MTTPITDDCGHGTNAAEINRLRAENERLKAELDLFLACAEKVDCLARANYLRTVRSSRSW